MFERIIDISTDQKYLSVHRGFMVVEEKGKDDIKIALDDIGGVIVCAHGIGYSNNLLVQLSKRNVPVVFCGSNFAPVSYLWSVEGHHLQSARIEAQLKASTPLNKRIWKEVVSRKIINQGLLLEKFNKSGKGLLKMAQRVRSGDPENLEAQAARRYWSNLFEGEFKRDQDASGLNAFLNYGYTIIRSAVARSIMASGLHPSLGIHHKNMYNSMRLVDDIMEPYRPFVDQIVYNLHCEGEDEMSSDVKIRLVSVLEKDVETSNGMTDMRNAIIQTTLSLAQIYQGEETNIFYPALSD